MLTTEPTVSALARRQGPRPGQPPTPLSRPVHSQPPGLMLECGGLVPRLLVVYLSHSAAPETNTPESWWLTSTQVDFLLTLPHGGPAGCGAGEEARRPLPFLPQEPLATPIPIPWAKAGPTATLGSVRVGKCNLSLCQEFWQMASVTALHRSCPVPQTTRSHHTAPLSVAWHVLPLPALGPAPRAWLRLSPVLLRARLSSLLHPGAPPLLCGAGRPWFRSNPCSTH